MPQVTVTYITPKDDFSGVERQLVAVIEVAETEVEAALERAYFLTQNLEGSWSQGPRLPDPHGRVDAYGNPVTWQNGDYSGQVQVMAPLHERNGKTYGLRSSMMNDEFELNGKVYRVVGCGFEEIK